MSHTVHDQAISLRVTREMPATPEEVFAAYTEPEAQRLWLTQLGPDEGEVRTAVDLRVGGVWEATFHPNPAVLVHDIFTFVEIDRPHRVVTRYTGESTVEGRVTAAPVLRTATRCSSPIPDGRAFTGMISDALRSWLAGGRTYRVRRCPRLNCSAPARSTFHRKPSPRCRARTDRQR